MARKRYTQGQIAFAIRQHESGTAIAEITRKMGIAGQTLLSLEKAASLTHGGAGMGLAEVRKLKSFEEENKKLKQLVADSALVKKRLQEVVRLRSEARLASAGATLPVEARGCKSHLASLISDLLPCHCPSPTTARKSWAIAGGRPELQAGGAKALDRLTKLVLALARRTSHSGEDAQGP